MTKGYMAEYDENLSAAETSNLARRFVIEDCALRYQISLQMAEKLIKNNAAVAPELSPKATRPDMEAVWPCRRMDRHDRRNSDDQVEEMMIDGCEERGEMAHGSSEAERRFPRTREELFHAGKPWYYVGQPRVPSFVQTAAMMPESGTLSPGDPRTMLLTTSSVTRLMSLRWHFDAILSTETSTRNICIPGIAMYRRKVPTATKPRLRRKRS